MEEIQVRTQRRIQVVDITEKIQTVLKAHTGAVLVFCPHTTCSVFLNEYEPDLAADFEAFVSELYQRKWRHDRHDQNAAAHLASSLFGHSAVVPVQDGRLALGTWQRVLLLECDGPRERHVRIRTL